MVNSAGREWLPQGLFHAFLRGNNNTLILKMCLSVWRGRNKSPLYPHYAWREFECRQKTLEKSSVMIVGGIGHPTAQWLILGNQLQNWKISRVFLWVKKCAFFPLWHPQSILECNFEARWTNDEHSRKRDNLATIPLFFIYLSGMPWC